MKKLIYVFLGLFSFNGIAQNDTDDVTITSEKLTDNIHVLYGRGGNIGLAIGDTYAYLIDDQFGALTEKILSKVKQITDKPVKFVLNTHWHGDHTGGNENLGNSGAIIIAHDNVRKRMSKRQERSGGRTTSSSPYAALPQITFNDEFTIHLDSLNSLHLIHVNNSHTDGDSYMYFPQSNVIHMGDNLTDGYPFIDINSNGDIDGFVKNLNMALFIVDEDTQIIPGHGKVMGRKDLVAYRDMLATLRMRVKKAKNDGKTIAEAQNMGLSSEWDTTHGQGFINSDRIIESIYKTVD